MTWWVWLLVAAGLGLWWYACWSLGRDIGRGPKKDDR